MILQQFNATKNHQLCKKFLHITDFFSHFSCGEHFPHNIMSCGEFLHMKICHVKKFLHMTKNSPQAPPVVPVTNIRYALQLRGIFQTLITVDYNWSPCSWLKLIIIDYLLDRIDHHSPCALQLMPSSLNSIEKQLLIKIYPINMS